MSNKEFSISDVFADNGTITLADLNRGKCLITIPKRSHPNETAETWELDQAKKYELYDDATSIQLITKPINNIYCIFRPSVEDEDEDGNLIYWTLQEFFIKHANIKIHKNDQMIKSMDLQVNIRIHCNYDKGYLGGKSHRKINFTFRKKHKSKKHKSKK